MCRTMPVRAARFIMISLFTSDWHKKWQGNVGINWQF